MLVEILSKADFVRQIELCSVQMNIYTYPVHDLADSQVSNSPKKKKKAASTSEALETSDSTKPPPIKPMWWGIAAEAICLAAERTILEVKIDERISTSKLMNGELKFNWNRVLWYLRRAAFMAYTIEGLPRSPGDAIRLSLQLDKEVTMYDY